MKKLFSLMAVCAMFAFAACETYNTGTNNGGTSNGGGENTDNTKKEELAKPEVEVKDVTSTGFTVTWAAVENAESYMVTVGEGQPQTITETSFKVEKLNAGTYTGSVIAVAAADSNYKNSKAATFSQAVTGLTPEECDWAESMAWLPTEELAEQGYYPFFNVLISYKGTGIVDIRAMAFDYETYGTTAIDSLIAECESIESEKVKIADANTENGLTIVYSLAPETKYRIVSVVTNEEGLSVVFDEEITTAAYTPTEAMAKWTGKWNLSAAKAVTLTVNGQNQLVPAYNDKDMSMPIEIIDFAPYYGNVNIVGIAGLTSQVWDDGSPIETLALIDEETGNLIVFGYSNGALADLGDGYILIWLSYCLSGGEITIALTDAWTLALSEDGQTITTAARETGEFSDGSLYEFIAMDIAALNTNTYECSFFYDFENNDEINLPAGDITLTKAAAEEETPSTQSASLKQFSAKKTFSSSLVVRM